MRRRSTFKPGPPNSAMTAIIGMFMLFFALVFISLVQSPPGVVCALLIVWILGVMVIVGHHVVIYRVVVAVRPGKMSTNIVEGENGALTGKMPAEERKNVRSLQDSKLIPDAECEPAQERVLQEV